jgi:hypothetical protein
MRGIWAAAVAATAIGLAAPAGAQTKAVGVWAVDLSTTCGIKQNWRGDNKNTIAWGINYVEKGKGLLLWFADSDTGFTPKEDLKLVLSVDKKWKKSVPAFAFDKNTAATLFQTTGESIDALMNGKNLEMTMEGKPDNYSGTFSLDDTRQAIAALDACKATAD